MRNWYCYSGLWMVLALVALNWGCDSPTANNTDNNSADGANQNAPSAPGDQGAEQRIISLDAASSEIILGLGVGDRLIGRDSGSVWPPEIESTPIVGDMYSFNPEAILALNPTLIIANTKRMRPQIARQLQSGGANFVAVEVEPTASGAIQRIRKLAKELDRKAEGEKIVAAVESDLERLAEKIAALEGDPPRVLCLYAMGNRIMVLGTSNNSVGMVRLVGAETAMPEIATHTSMNAEAVINAKPDAILIGCAPEAMESLRTTLLENPALAQTPAGQNQRVIMMEKVYLGGFGPRVGQAALELFEALHHSDGPHLSKAVE